MIPQSGENLSMTTPKLSARRLSKAFGPVTVLHDVDVDFFAGEHPRRRWRKRSRQVDLNEDFIGNPRTNCWRSLV